MRREIEFNWIAERELPGLTSAETRYVVYDLDVLIELERECAPAPHWYSGSVLARVCTVSIFEGDSVEPLRQIHMDPEWIGPVEPGIAGPGHAFYLDEAEQERAGEHALEIAMLSYEPDPDEQYDMRLDRQYQ